MPKGNHLILSTIMIGLVLLAGPFGGIGCQQPEVHYGSISGQVTDDSDNPIEGVTVTVFGTGLAATTDRRGNYQIDDVPVAAPRYIITAEKSDFIEGQAGNIDVVDGETAMVNMTMHKETSKTLRHKEKLRIKFCYLVEIQPTEKKLVPAPDAVLDPSLYPEQVKLYLKPSKYIESDDPYIVKLAWQIKSSLLPWDRDKQTKVAKAIYNWTVKNIEYDLMENFPGDVTCGNWQTTHGGWGHSFNEWCFTAKEVLEEKRAICIEYERLCTALLRAAGIPARPALIKAHPVTQWWVQLPNGSGYWANMETSAGHTIYMQNGDLQAKFPSQTESNIAFHAINEDAPIHMDWYTQNPCLWLEDYGERRIYKHDAEGLRAAKQDMNAFATEGKLPLETASPQETPSMSSPYYELYSRGFMIDLANIGDQEMLQVQFPLFTENGYRSLLKTKLWANYLAWFAGSKEITRQDEQTNENLSYYQANFRLVPSG